MNLREQIRIAIGGALAAQEGSDGAADAVMEVLAKQEPFSWIVRGGYPVPLDKLEWQLWCGSEKPTLSWVNQEMRPLYALPGAQNVPKTVAYLDLGVGGYMDIGTDLTDEELATLPKGRHMLGIIGTYGVDGYVPAQPAPSVPECPYPCGWRNLLKHAIEDGAYLARSINEDEPVTENARAVTMRTVMRLRNVLMAINNAAPEAKP